MHNSEKLFVSLIPDGGRRAVANDMTLFKQSYERGAEVVGDILKACVQDARVGIFAAWGLSDDNATKRSRFEVNVLSEIFLDYLRRLRGDLETDAYKAVKVVHMGDPRFIREDVAKSILEITTFTADRAGELLFGLGLGYGAHDEMDRAVALHVADKNKATMNWKEYLDIPVRSKQPYQHVDLMYRTGTPAEEAYTSGYLIPYMGPKTLLRFNPEFLPNISASDFMASVDETWRLSGKQRTGG